MTIPPNMNWKRFKNRLRDLSEEEEEIAEVEREEDEEEIAFGPTFGVVIRWCLGQRLGGDGVGIGVVFGWLNEIEVCSPWVWVSRYGSGICSPWVCCHGFGFCSLWVFFFFFCWWWVLLTVLLFSGGGVGNGLWSRFVFVVVARYVVWVGFKFDGHGVGHDGSECGSWL